jgi:hypothetical protein
MRALDYDVGRRQNSWFSPKLEETEALRKNLVGGTHLAMGSATKLPTNENVELD